MTIKPVRLSDPKWSTGRWQDRLLRATIFSESRRGGVAARTAREITAEEGRSL
jgi:hypothetical protein